jgi:hypothetical protein
MAEVYTPGEWGESYWFFEGIEDLQQRRALALISAFGTPGGGDKVAFVADQIVIASPEVQGCEMQLTVRPLEEFLSDYGNECDRMGDPMALRWVEKIVHWPELGC